MSSQMARIERIYDSLEERRKSLSTPIATYDLIERLERHWGLTFPDDYKSVISSFPKGYNFPGTHVTWVNGSRAWLAFHRVGELSGVAHELYERDDYSLSYSDRGSIQLDRTVPRDQVFHHAFGPDLPWLDGLVPISIASDWNDCFCFDFTFDAQRPPLVYVDLILHQQDVGGIEFAADTFTELLENAVTLEDFDRYHDERIGERHVELTDLQRRWVVHRDEQLAGRRVE